MLSAPARTGSFVLALACATVAAHAQPADPRPTLVVRVVDPAPVSFEATALGRATHHLRMSLTNSGTQPVQLEALSFRVLPMKDGVLFSCSDLQSKDERWPATLDPGASFNLTRDVSCDTPLPGRYDVALRARPRGGPAEAERTYGSFAMHIEPGANPPVRLPWDTSLHAAASGTKELRPSKDPNKARIVVALVNGTRNAVTLAPVHAVLRISRRGSTVAPCAPREADLPFSGSLAPGRSQTLPMPVGCDLSAEAVYDVDVSINHASGAKVHLATHAIRVGVLPPPPPRPEDAPTGKIIGGM